MIAGIFACLAIFGIDARALSLSAGVAGVIFSIGCQSIVADILAGILMTFEGVVHVGDFLFFNEKPQEVLSIGVRTTRLKFFSEVTVVRNNDFKNFILRPVDQAALLPLSLTVDLRESLERVEEIIKEETPALHEKLCAASDETSVGPQYLGVRNITDSGVELGFNVFCKGRYHYFVNLAMNRALKMMCERRGIAIAMPQVGIVTTLIFVFINAWNEYTISTVLISTAANRPITVGITQFSSFNMIEWQYLFAASLLATIPVVILFMAIEKHLTSGLTSGGVKG